MIAHPECEEAVLRHADFIGSTKALFKYAVSSPAQTFIVVTEEGILHQMRRDAPGKTFIPAPPEDESCACNQCPHMRLNTLEKLYLCLRDLGPHHRDGRGAAPRRQEAHRQDDGDVGRSRLKPFRARVVHGGMTTQALAVARPSTLPPGPRGALWQSLRYLRDPMGMIATAAKEYGDPFTVPTLVRPLVLTGSPEGVRAIFGADPDTFSPFAGEMGVALVGRGSMLLQHGSRHRRARKLTQPMFHGARMRAYGQRMAEIAEANFRRAPRRAFDIEEVFRTISLEVILSTVFGVDAAALKPTRESVLSMIRAFNPLIAMFAFLRRGFFPPWRRFERLKAEVQRLLRDQMRSASAAARARTSAASWWRRATRTASRWTIRRSSSS